MSLKRAGASCVVVVLLAMAGAACDNDPAPTTTSGNEGSVTSDAPAPVDLQPVDMRIENSGQPEPLTHQLIFEMRNNEAGKATDFDFDCRYDNAGTSGGIDAVTAGVLSGHSSFTYTQLFALQGPSPSNAHVKCTVDPDNAVSETREDNNVIEFGVAVP